ncbi:hypothetical protein LMH87_001842 [Akanthomyces muscarius]|uniref:Uncharacterized protein n=1 Tax=Akanthomyces muscarius TaxID=2231603 RepID=A0A9W8UHZ3_AKAMU|nr:hypothetical protein LMH87_001842 [Akanthomyces muscarius]KAJ4147310.1 hypothetical protein LMH87_001842 [Akanthomyces muscarius]
MSVNVVNSDSENSDGFVVTDKPNKDSFGTSPLAANKLTKVREWLQPTAYDISGGEYRKHASSYLSGTGDWLTALPEYQQWLTNRDHGLLWVKGIPGSGKSVMAAKLIAELTTSEPKCPVLYFFFRQIIDANHEPAALLRDWMDQLLEHSPVLQQQLYSYVKDGRSLESVSPDDMWKDLKMAFACLTGKVFCITDALDEMDHGNDSFLQALANLGLWRPDRVKVLMTSRPVPSVETPLHSISCLKIRLQEDEVDNDISHFVKHSLKKSQIDEKYWPSIISAVPGRANGLFLYARLTMDTFLKPDTDIETALARLPTDLGVLYTNLLAEHFARSGVDEQIQRLILQAVTHATRPLRLLEIAEMLSVVDESSSLKARKDLVKAACGPLLEILADETVSVIHHSFTEYLKGVTRPKGGPGYPVVDSGDAHEQLASACLRYLQSGSLDNFPASLLEQAHRSTTDAKVTLWQKYPFIKYATGNWFKHVVAACSASSDDSELCTKVSQFLGNDFLRRVWCRLEWKSNAWDVSQAHVAARLGLTGYIGELIRRGEDVDSLDGHGRTPVWWAASEGHADTVKKLIAADAKLYLTDTVDGFTPLHKAAQKNHFLVARLLLQADVSPLIRKGLGSTSNHTAHVIPDHGESPLRCACERGHFEVFDEMLKHVANIEKVHWALAWAACSGQSRLVARILEYPGVNVNTKVHGNTFLYSACGSLDFETINLLLQAGADVHALSIGDRHPLAVDIDYTPKPTSSATHSCLRGMFNNSNLECINRDTIMMENAKKLLSSLFAAGLDVNHHDSMGQTILHRATNSAELVRALVVAGADATAVDRKKNTPLHSVSKPEAISILVEDGGADVNAKNKEGKTPLHCAVRGSPNVISTLLEYGSDCDIADHDGNSALHLLLDRSSYNAGPEHVRLLLRAGADPNVKNHRGLTPFRSISSLQSGQESADCLIQAGADIDAKDNEGRTALFDAVGKPSLISQERVWTLEYLIDAGASKQIQDFQGRKIAHEAIKGVTSQHDIGLIVQWLDVLDSLELLDLEAVDNAGNGLLHELCFYVDNRRHKRDVGMHLIRLLTGAGLDMSRKNHAGQTPLHLLCAKSCDSGGSSFVFNQPPAYVIRNGKKVDEIDANGNTALHVASAYEPSWCKLLLDAGADPTRRNHDGLTPLHLAARCKQSNTVGMLLTAIHDRLGDTVSEELAVINAQVVTSSYNVYEPFGITALFYACQSGRPESVKLLLDAGADPNIGSPFVACAQMEHETRLWTAKEAAPGTAVAALRTFDTTRPPIPTLAHRSEMFHSFATTRLEEILDLLVSAGINLSLLDGDGTGQPNPFSKASSLGSSYAYKCLKTIKDKYADTAYPDTAHIAAHDPAQGLRLLDEQLVTCGDAASVGMIQESGWLKTEGVDMEIFRAVIIRRQYHLIEHMIQAGCRFLVQGIQNLEYLIIHGLASLFDEISQAETQALLSEGEWHAFGDPSKAGLHFQPKSQGGPEDGQVGGGMSKQENRNLLLEHATRRSLPNMEIVELLVGKYAVNINGGNRDKDTALHIIARGQHWWQGALALPFLLKSGADVEYRNSDGQTPLHLALDKEYLQLGELGPFHRDVAEALIGAGADVNAIDAKGRSCLDLAGYSTKLIDLLVSNGAVIGSSSIFAALKSDNGAALEKLLQGGADANGRMPFIEENLRDKEPSDDCYMDGSRMTFDAALVPRHEIVPLYYIASKSAFPEDADMRSCFRKLLNHGADIYATFKVQRGGRQCRPAYGEEYNKAIGVAEAGEDATEQRTVLHELVRLGKLSKCVADAVAINPDCRDPKGCTLLHAVCDSWGGPDRVIDTTSDKDDSDDGVADTDKKKEDGITAFQQLLALGCDIQARDASGQSIVHHMVYRGWKHPQKLWRLENSVAEIARISPELLSAPNASGNTPLHYSALLATSTRRSGKPDHKDRMVDLTRLLLRSGANPTGINDDGNSILHLMAHNLDHGDVAALFAELVARDNGLDVNARNARGETPLMIYANRTSVLLRLKGEGGRCGLVLVHEEAAVDAGVAMLKAAGADFGVLDAQGNGLLHRAAADEVQLFRALMVRGGLDPMRENEAHQTAIDVAATYSNNEILALFENKV